MTLALARQRALENAQSIAEGRDPRRRSGRGAPTFADAVEKVMAIHAGNWKPGGRTEESWRATLRDYVLPRLGDMPVDAITGSDVMAVLQPIWTAKRETAKRVRARIGAVMKWAVAQGHRADNPAGDTLAAALRKVRGSNAYRGAALAFELLVLTATRSGEVRYAIWDDVDLESAVWTIPAERMKAGLAHRVPLSDQALGACAVENFGILKTHLDEISFLKTASNPHIAAQNRLRSACRSHQVGRKACYGASS